MEIPEKQASYGIAENLTLGLYLLLLGARLAW